MALLKNKDEAKYRQNVFPTVPRGRKTSYFRRPFDVYLFFTTLLLVLIGIMMIFSSSAIFVDRLYKNVGLCLKSRSSSSSLLFPKFSILHNIAFILILYFLYNI